MLFKSGLPSALRFEESRSSNGIRLSSGKERKGRYTGVSSPVKIGAGLFGGSRLRSTCPIEMVVKGGGKNAGSNRKDRDGERA